MSKIIDQRVIKIPPLKPCPFCARKTFDVIEWDHGKYSVSCKCGCESPHDSSSLTAMQRVWNRRRYNPDQGGAGKTRIDGGDK